jgi:hypothetical protein
MVKPLFYVDLSEDARDYRHTALEPGLPLLDRQGVNFQILRKWLGDVVAEPEWQNQNTIAFYMVDEERGRLEDVDCQPTTRGEMEKLFAKDLDAIRAKVKKIKPESSTEQMVSRILKKSLAEQTNDLENSDFDSFFFKCRAGKEDWRLVWCCGYQRADLEPLKARIWNTPDGEFLGVRPPLQGGRAKKRKRTGPLDVLTSPWLAIALILLIAAFVYFFRPKLVVSPAEWAGPLGSQIEYKVEDRRWFFFNNDVTLRTLAQSHDPRVVEFGRSGVADAKSIGKTFVSFRLGNRLVDATVDVGPPKVPDALTIEPAENVRVAIGSTRQLRAFGNYQDGSKVDLTKYVTWSGGDSQLLKVYGTDAERDRKGLIEGYGVGQTKVAAMFATPDAVAETDRVVTEIDVQVVVADFTSLAVTLQPGTFAIGQSSRVEVVGIDKDNQQHSLTGSSLLRVRVDPTNLAGVDGDYLVGRAEGAGEVKVAYGDLDKTIPFTVAGRMLAEDVFLVSPTRIEDAVVYELIPLNVTTGSDLPITAVSANTDVVDVFRTEDENAGYEVWLAARRAGDAEVTVSQGSKSQVVRVTVTGGLIERIDFVPELYSLRVGESTDANLVAITQEDRRRIKVVPDALVWERRPRVESVYIDQQTLTLRGLEATDDLGQPMRVALGRTALTASGTVVVRGGDMLAFLEADDAFGVHGPVPTRGRYIDVGSYLGDDVLMYDNTRGLIVGTDVDPFSPLGIVPRGSQIVELNGIALDQMSPEELAAYFRSHRIGEGDVLRYRGRDGLLGTVLLGDRVGVVRDFKLLDVLSTNVTPQAFDADLRMYLRQSGEYRLTDAAGAPLSEWAAYPQDATPLMSLTGVARNADDDYELYVERRIGDQVRRFQVPFKLEPERTTVPVVAPVIQEVDDDADYEYVDAPDGTRTRVRKTIRTIRRPATGSSSTVIRGPDGAVAATRPDLSSPSAPAPGSPAPGSPAPAPGSPSPAPPAPGSPAPAPPAPGSPAPAPPAPGSPAPAPPSPADPTPKPTTPPPAQPAPAPPASPNPDKPAPSAYPADVAQNPDSRPPVQGSAVPAGATASKPGVTGTPARGSVTGKTTAGTPSKSEPEKKSSSLLDALKDFNRERRNP